MLVTKKISLGIIGETIDLVPSVIKSEERNIATSIEKYVLKKKVEADTIISNANESAKAIARETREQAELEFWRQAQTFCDELQSMRTIIVEEVEQKCGEVVIACLTSVLGEVENEDKIRSLISELLADNFNEDVATVFVHPEQLEYVSTLIRTMSIPVKADDRLETDSVVLKTEKSQFKSSFRGKLSLLIRALESI